MLKTWLNFFGVLIMKSHWLEKWEIEQDEKTEDIEERLAIMEYDGNMSRQDAEKKILEYIETDQNLLKGVK